jgi:hypothetical protein
LSPYGLLVDLVRSPAALRQLPAQEAPEDRNLAVLLPVLGFLLGLAQAAAEAESFEQNQVFGLVEDQIRQKFHGVISKKSEKR